MDQKSNKVSINTRLNKPKSITLKLTNIGDSSTLSKQSSYSQGYVTPENHKTISQDAYKVN